MLVFRRVCNSQLLSLAQFRCHFLIYISCLHWTTAHRIRVNCSDDNDDENDNDCDSDDY